MNIVDAMQWRYAVNEFSDKTVTQQQLDVLVEAVRLTPSAFGLQPYRLLVVQSQELRSQLLPHSMGQDKVVNSSHLLVFAIDTHDVFERIDTYIEQVAQVQQVPEDSLEDYKRMIQESMSAKTPNELHEWATRQAYIALGNCLTVAATLKIDACPMEGVDMLAYDKVLKLAPMNLKTVLVCPIGFRHPDDHSACRSKVRPALNDWLVEL